MLKIKYILTSALSTVLTTGVFAHGDERDFIGYGMHNGTHMMGSSFLGIGMWILLILLIIIIVLIFVLVKDNPQ